MILRSRFISDWNRLLIEWCERNFLTNHVAKSAQVGRHTSRVQREPGLFRIEQILDRVIVHDRQVNRDVHIPIRQIHNYQVGLSR